MSEENFTSIGMIEAVQKLYEGTPFRAFETSSLESEGRSRSILKSSVLLEGIDFDLVYFPLKHLGYKSVIEVTAALYAEMAHPAALDVILGISAKLDFSHIKEIWSGITTAASEHGYSKVNLNLVPSRNGLTISISAIGECPILHAKRRPQPKSMDLICVSGNLGAAYLGLSVLEREKKKWAEKDGEQPDLGRYRQLVGAYLKPEIPAHVVENLEDCGIYPSAGLCISKGLGSALKTLVRETGLGAKVYVDRIPFEGNSFDTGKELGIDPVTAALNGGDDYRLLFTVPISLNERFRRDFQTFDVIGHLAKPEVGAVVVTPDGVELPVKAQGWKDDE